jgi:hypothetical protein
MASSLVNPSDVVNQTQWNNLITDVNTANLHIQGTSVSVSLHSEINYTDLQTLDTDANTLGASRNTIFNTQKTQDPVPANGKATVGAAWGAGSGYVTSYAHVYFNSDAEMQYFFNQGSTIDIYGVGSGLTTPPQDVAWDTLLNGTVVHVDLLSFTSMSTTAMTQITLNTSANANYGSNTVQISAMRFSNFIVFRVRFTDGHLALGGGTLGGPGPDIVSGNNGYKIQWTRSSGAFTGIQPDVYVGQFTSDTSTLQGGFTASTPAPIPQYNSSGNVFTHNITKNIQNYNLYYMMLAHGWPGNTSPQDATITISGVYLWSNRVSVAALRLDNITGGIIKVVNNGFIMGQGGNGGTAIADELGTGLVGGNGGTAIQLGSLSTTVTNTAGYILGGGGGGGAAGVGSIAGGDYHYGGGGGGAGGGRGGAGWSSAAYLNSTIAVSPGGTSTNSLFAIALPGTSGQSGGSGAIAPSGGSGGRVYLSLAVLNGPSGTNLTPGYGGQIGGTGGIWGGPLDNLTATGGYGGVVISGQNAPMAGGAGSSTVGNPGSIGTGGGGSWGGAGGAGSYNGLASSAGGTGGKAVDLNGKSITWSGGDILTRRFGSVA